MEPMQDKQQNQHRQRTARIDPEPGHRVTAEFQNIQQIHHNSHNSSHWEHQTDVAYKTPDYRLDQVFCTLFAEGKNML